MTTTTTLKSIWRAHGYRNLRPDLTDQAGGPLAVRLRTQELQRPAFELGDIATLSSRAGHAPPDVDEHPYPLAWPRDRPRTVDRQEWTAMLLGSLRDPANRTHRGLTVYPPAIEHDGSFWRHLQAKGFVTIQAEPTPWTIKVLPGMNP